MGSFFTEINIPDLKKYPLKFSSIVLQARELPRLESRRKRPKRSPDPQWPAVEPNIARALQSPISISTRFTMCTIRPKRRRP